GPGVIETLVLGIDQDRGGRVGVKQRLPSEVAGVGARPDGTGLARGRQRCPSAFAGCDREHDLARAAAGEVTEYALLLADRLELAGKLADRFGGAEDENAALA